MAQEDQVYETCPRLFHFPWWHRY